MLRHHEHHPIAAHRRSHRQRDAGVARGRLDQRIAGLDRTPPFSLENHRQRGSILDRSGGVVALELRQQHVVRLAGQALQPHERRIADGAFDGLIHGACARSKSSIVTPTKTPPRGRGRRGFATAVTSLSFPQPPCHPLLSSWRPLRLPSPSSWRRLHQPSPSSWRPLHRPSPSLRPPPSCPCPPWPSSRRPSSPCRPSW